MGGTLAPPLAARSPGPACWRATYAGVLRPHRLRGRQVRADPAGRRRRRTHSGGNDQPEDWYQTNEITRLVANRIGGRANYLFAPALPGPDLYPSLLNDPTIQRVLHLWPRARCALMGVGAPPLMRSDIPRFVPLGSDSLRSAVGDVCSRFYDRTGQPVDFEGRERLIAIELETLRHIPVTIGVAVGRDKVDSIIGGALGGLFQPARHRSRDGGRHPRQPEPARCRTLNVRIR